jgi:hypothetical protein
MTSRSWIVHVEGAEHTVELDHSYFTGKRTIKLDGQIVARGSRWLDAFGSDDSFPIAGRVCSVQVRTHGLTYTYDCSLDGRSVRDGRMVLPLAPAPKWAWLFIAACIGLPIVTFGGLVPALFGVAGAIACLAIARNPRRPIVSQITLSIGVVVLCWALGGLTVWGTQQLAASDRIAWRDYTSKAGAYSILMPGQPDEQKQSVDTSAGRVDVYTSIFENRAGAFIVAYTDYPNDAVQGSDPQALLDSAINNLQGTLLNKANITLDGFPGREFEVEIPSDGTRPTGVMTARHFLVGHRLYQVAVVTPKNPSTPDNAPKFLDSFRLMK